MSSASIHDRPGHDRLALWPYSIALAIWGLDFRAASSGAAALFQGTLLATYGVVLLWTCIAAARRRIGIGPLWVLISVTVLFMIDSFIVGLIRDQPQYALEVNLVPALLYLSASALTFMTLSLAGDRTPAVLNGLRIACLASVIGHLLVVFVTSGINFASTRYEILSGATVPSLGIIAVGLAQRLSKLDLLTMLLNLLVSLLSVTRTLLIVLAVQVAMIFGARPSMLVRGSTLRGMALFGAVVLIGVALDFVSGIGLTARWISRLFLSSKLGTDPSALLRLAETHYMWDRFTSSLQTLVFGNGLAAVTSAIGREDVRVAMLVGRPSAVIHMIGIGHENYVSILYVAGLLGGGGLLLLQFVNGFQSLALIRKLEVRPSVYTEAQAHIGIWGGLIVAGMLTVGFLAGTFGDRDYCLWFGVGTGMLYWGRELVRPRQSPQAG